MLSRVQLLGKGNSGWHGRLRLALLSLLSSVEEAEFTWLREATDGNLGAQLLKLEAAAYVAAKKFVSRKPRTLYRITEDGSPSPHRIRLGVETVASSIDDAAPRMILIRYSMVASRPSSQDELALRG